MSIVRDTNNGKQNKEHNEELQKQNQEQNLWKTTKGQQLK